MSCSFGLAQSDKIRASDDLSGSLVNSAYGSSYQLAGVDGISLLLRSFLEAVSNDRKVCLKLSTDVLRGMLHPSFQYERPSGARSSSGFGLQTDMGIQSHLRTSILAIEDDQQHRHLFISNVLPFGPSNSVYAFNLMARSLHTIGP